MTIPELKWEETDGHWQAKMAIGEKAFIFFKLETLPEDAPVRGNAIASDNPKMDRLHENAILERIEAWDSWAWCTVKVSASFGSTLEGTAYLGCCSYEGFEDFAAEDGYLPSLVQEAMDELLQEARDTVADGNELLEAMKGAETDDG